MPILWTPNGVLDIATDPSDLPEQADGKDSVSGAMTRCTNMQLDRQGIASTRRGSDKLNGSALESSVNCLIEQNGKRYAFSGTKIYEDEIELETGLTDALWDAVLYSPFSDETWNVFATNGTDLKRIEDGVVNEWGIEPPTAAPTLTPVNYIGLYDWEVASYSKVSKWGIEQDDYVCIFQSEVDLLTGEDGNFLESYSYYATFGWEYYYSEDTAANSQTAKYHCVYTYCRKEGDVLVCESNPSPVGYANVTSGIWLAWVASADPQVTHLRIYRSLADAPGVYYFDSEYGAGLIGGAYNKRDSELGTAVAIDHDRPPTGITKLLGPVFNGVIFGMVGNKLYYCKPNQPEYWPAAFYLEVGPPQLPLQSGTVFGGQLFVANQFEIWSIIGTGATTFYSLPMGSQTGTLSSRVFCPIKGLGICHLGLDGLYLFASGQDTNVTKPTLYPLFEETTVGSIPGIDRTYVGNCWAINWENKLWFGYPSNGATYPDNVIVYDLGENKRSVHFQYPFEIRCVAPDKANKRLLAGDSDGYVWEINKLGATQDESTDISWQIQSKEFVQFQMYFPRYARYDVNLNNGATATGRVLLAGTIKQSHSITTDRNRKKRIVTTCTGPRLSVRIDGTGPVDIYGAQVE